MASLYADRIATSSDRPVCWGSKESYDPNDDDCDACTSQHTCRQQVNSLNRPSFQQLSRPSQPVTNYHPVRTQSSAEQPTWTPGLTYEGESVILRLVKDGITGALRGLCFELYRFFTGHRF